MHSYLLGQRPTAAELIAIGREECAATREILAGRAVDVTRTDGGHFRVELASARCRRGPRVIAAHLTGDVSPTSKSREHWGAT
jgi:hypothetical protein